MFTGLITHLGQISSLEKKGDWRFVIDAKDFGQAVIGASIACSGVCLTVIESWPDRFAVQVSAESLSKTNLGQAKVDDVLNLEKSLRVGDELGGHFVSGHVDACAGIKDIQAVGDSHVLTIELPQGLQKMLVKKGSVTLNGVSLTVNDVMADAFSVNIIPHTWQVTNLGQMKKNDLLNLEIDVLARYIARQIEG